MRSHFFAYISRMRFIQRWALMRNTAPENVQEHSHQTAVLAQARDLPTPIKYDNPAIRSAYKDVEAVAEGKLLAMLPEGLRDAYRPVLTEVDPEVRRLVKAADKLSAHIKCVEELKAGNLEFREAAAQTRRALEGYGMPEVRYFLETFLESFSLTLDELK